MEDITKESIQEKSNLIHNGEYEILSEYKSHYVKIQIKHKICGNTFSQTAYKHLYQNKCPVCFGHNRLSKEILQEKSDEKYNGEYEILGEYINNATKILIKHKICNSEYYQVPNNHLRNRRCFSCYGTPKKTNESFQEESNKVHKNDYILLSDYIESNDIVTLLHKRCDKEFDVIAYSHIKGAKCPFCFHSKGEDEISDFLTKYKMKYNNQKSFDNCQFRIKLRFDFYLPELNICIEFDGEQHFKPIKWFGGEKAFEECIIKDEIKNKFCEDNGIKLLRISYLENVELKLKEFFNI
jgi:very-short-patch-repair endonuclease/uncharacterized protein YozE (UPF0346 family)